MLLLTVVVPGRARNTKSPERRSGTVSKVVHPGLPVWAAAAPLLVLEAGGLAVGLAG